MTDQLMASVGGRATRGRLDDPGSTGTDKALSEHRAAAEAPDAVAGSASSSLRGTQCGQTAVPRTEDGVGANASGTQCGQTAVPRPAGRVGVAPATECGQSALTGAASSDAALSTDASLSTDAAPSAAQKATECGQTALTGAAPEGVNAPLPGSTPSTSCGQPEPDSGDGRYLDPVEMSAWRTFLAASTEVTARLNHELENGVGISMHEYEILVRLLEAPARTLRMSALADDVSHSRSRLTHTVGRLEREGYVERVACSQDRRGVNCVLTDAGADFLATAAPIHLQGVRRHVIDRLSREDLETLTRLLSGVAWQDED